MVLLNLTDFIPTFTIRELNLIGISCSLKTYKTNNLVTIKKNLYNKAYFKYSARMNKIPYCTPEYH